MPKNKCRNARNINKKDNTTTWKEHKPPILGCKDEEISEMGK